MEFYEKNGKSFISSDVKIGKDVTIYGGCFIEGKTEIGDGVTIYPNNIIRSCKIGNNCTLMTDNILTDCIIGNNTEITKGSVLNNCKIGNDCKIIYTVGEDAVCHDGVSVGPFARLRPDAEIMDGAKIGNFVEVKNAVVGKGTKAQHLTYVGDCDIGSNCNLGCGVIFVNYNGKTKSRSKVGNDSFIGSNSNVIAPVNIGDKTYICAGTTVTEDIEDGAFVIGRSRQIAKSGRAKTYLKENK